MLLLSNLLRVRWAQRMMFSKFALIFKHAFRTTPSSKMLGLSFVINVTTSTEFSESLWRIAHATIQPRQRGCGVDRWALTSDHILPLTPIFEAERTLECCFSTIKPKKTSVLTDALAYSVRIETDSSKSRTTSK